MPHTRGREVSREPENILAEARRLAALVRDLLALARADAGVPLRRQRLELDRVLLEAMKLILPRAATAPEGFRTSISSPRRRLGARSTGTWM